jgi:hypothetical protein
MEPDTGTRKLTRQHNYRVGTYERKAHDFHPTPSDLVVALRSGCHGSDLNFLESRSLRAVATARSAAVWPPCGIDVPLSDLDPERRGQPLGNAGQGFP